MVITGDLFKLVHLRIPPLQYWHLVVATNVGSMHPTWMLSFSVSYLVKECVFWWQNKQKTFYQFSKLTLSLLELEHWTFNQSSSVCVVNVLTIADPINFMRCQQIEYFRFDLKRETLCTSGNTVWGSLYNYIITIEITIFTLSKHVTHTITQLFQGTFLFRLSCNSFFQFEYLPKKTQHSRVMPQMRPKWREE